MIRCGGTLDLTLCKNLSRNSDCISFSFVAAVIMFKSCSNSVISPTVAKTLVFQYLMAATRRAAACSSSKFAVSNREKVSRAKPKSLLFWLLWLNLKKLSSYVLEWSITSEKSLTFYFARPFRIPYKSSLEI